MWRLHRTRAKLQPWSLRPPLELQRRSLRRTSSCGDFVRSGLTRFSRQLRNQLFSLQRSLLGRLGGSQFSLLSQFLQLLRLSSPLCSPLCCPLCNPLRVQPAVHSAEKPAVQTAAQTSVQTAVQTAAQTSVQTAVHTSGQIFAQTSAQKYEGIPNDLNFEKKL